MQFQVDIADTPRLVAVERDGERFKVTVNGRVHYVDAARVGAEALSMLVARDGSDALVRRIDAAVVPGLERGSFTISVNGQDVPVHLRTGGAGRRREAAAASGSGPQRVLAPMPGKVVRVLVAAGDAVKAKQGLVVVEAMKMENELKASRAGRVREVQVSEGQSVDAGAVLVIVE
jgi:biotin carboxyl carrier protein